MAEFAEGDLKRLASLVAHGLSDEQISSALGQDEATIRLAKEDPVYKAAISEKLLENFEGEIDRVTGWDNVETKAVNGLSEVLAWNKNPDFLLKTAAIANRAVRTKANTARNMLDATRIGQVVVLQLNQRFVTGLNGQLDLTIEHGRELPAKKQIDTPNPRMVENFLLRDTGRELAHPRDSEVLDAEVLGELEL